MDNSSSLHVSAEAKNLALIRRFVKKAATTCNYDPAAIADIILAVNEAATNIIVHGYQGRPGFIEIEVGRQGKDLAVCLRDQATPFDPTTAPPPDLTLPLEIRRFGGMGVYMIRQLVDQINHRVTPEGGNELTLVKKKRREATDK